MLADHNIMVVCGGGGGDHVLYVNAYVPIRVYAYEPPPKKKKNVVNKIIIIMNYG